ncbi:MAG: hypothetical protein BroJett011_18300 [Chloroflexota bacterium]|nr:MAG: hypothetical protein BroJett011_18300 [Chloroflexota bacterium]
MTIQTAFATLLAAIETAFQESLKRSNTAAQQGDFDAVELEVERQRNLVAIRNQLQTLQEMWLDVVGERAASTSAEPQGQPVGYGDILSEGYNRVLTALHETGGPEAVAEAVNRVGKQITEATSGLNVDPWQWLFGKKHPTAQTQEEAAAKPRSPGPMSKATEVKPSTTSITTQSTAETIDRPIFAVYKRRRFEATFLPDHRVIYNGQGFASPSGAAQAITQTHVNGWKFWRYVNEQGRERFISDLQAQQPIMKTEKPAPLLSSPRKPRSKRLGRGIRTAEEAFYLPILAVLVELNGRGSANEVLDLIGQRMTAQLNEVDRQTIKSGRQVRWRNTAQWARQKMKDKGLLAADSSPGIWEITEAGRAYFQEYREHST